MKKGIKLLYRCKFCFFLAPNQFTLKSDYHAYYLYWMQLGVKTFSLLETGTPSEKGGVDCSGSLSVTISRKYHLK